jgi:hypothetical protein
VATPRSLAMTTSYLGGAVLSSDGELVAYGTSDRLGENVYTTPFQGGGVTPVTREPASTGAYATLGWYPGIHRLLYMAWSGREKRQLYWQDLPRGARRRAPDPGLGAAFYPLADGGFAVYGPGPKRVLAFRDSSGNEVSSVTLPDSLGAVIIPVGEDVDHTGILLTAGTVSTVSMPLVRVDRQSGRLTLIGMVPSFGASVTRVLSGSAAGATYATWRRGARTGTPTLWRVAPGRPNIRLRDLPMECDDQSLVASANLKRFICISSAERPDIFLLEQFDRYSR